MLAFYGVLILLGASIGIYLSYKYPDEYAGINSLNNRSHAYVNTMVFVAAFAIYLFILIVNFFLEGAPAVLFGCMNVWVFAKFIHSSYKFWKSQKSKLSSENQSAINLDSSSNTSYSSPSSSMESKTFDTDFDEKTDFGNSDVMGRYWMRYEGYNGDVSEREILLFTVYEKKNHIYIEAFCELANETRTFRPDRILKLKNLDTDEYIKEDIEEYFYGLLQGQPKSQSS